MALSISLAVISVRSTSAAAVQPLAPVTQADGRLGLCDVLPGAPPTSSSVSWAQLAYNAGARVDRWEVRWDQVEPRSGVWDYSAADYAIQSAQNVGMQVEGILIGTPAWAVAAGQRPGNGMPTGAYLPYTDPRNLWADYVRQTVTRYAAEVDYWEIWNEPDLQFFWMSSPQDYFRLLRVAYRVIKEADPGAQVIMAGMIAPDLGFLSRVLDAANLDPGSQTHHGYFDAAAWHAYGPARLLYTNIVRFKALLAQKGYPDAPVWVTEDGFPANNPNGEPRQAAYVLQTVAYAFAAGASRLLIYRASDSAEPKTWGLMTPDGVPRMGYVAFQVAAQNLSNVRAVTYEPTAGLERFVFYEPAQRVTMLWGRGVADQNASVFAGQESAEEVSWMGQQTALTASQGQFRITVPGARYNAGIDPTGTVVGGPPVLVVEDNAPPADLTSQIYLAPVAGTGRRLVIFNQGDTASSVQVAAAAQADNRIVVQMPAHAVRTVDLDLLAGSAYREMYALSSSTGVTAEAVSDRAVVNGIQPASIWYLAAAPPNVTIANTANRGVTALVTAFGPRGVVRAHQTLRLQPMLRQDLALPALNGTAPVSLSIQATGPVVVASAHGAASNPVSRPQPTWYAVHPQAASLSVFNPNAAKSAQVTVHFLGSALKTEQVQISPHHAFALSSADASAVVIAANQGITAGYTRHAEIGTLASQSTTRTAVDVAGQASQLAVFNPTTKAAHVSLSVVGPAHTTQLNETVAPSQVSVVPVRKPTDPARGVVLSSDVPVVASPAS